MSGPQVGEQAPDFTLPDQHGNDFHLADRLGPVVLFFFPQASTPVCSAEICAFRDETAAFNELDCTTAGISADIPKALAAFTEDHGITFPLLSDHKNAVRKLYGAQHLWTLPARVTFVIDENDTIRKRFESNLQARAHVDEALAALREIRADRPDS